MAREKIERKISVIFATDVVGYSKHMETDESETIHNLRECEAILLSLFKKHDGRLFNTGGDSFLAEFPSAVSAVECAVDFQNEMRHRNTLDDTSVKLEFRIGINSGDVVKEKDNLLGDGVNIAARLEAIAQTSGITISKVIYDYVKGKTKYHFNDIGIQKIKQNEFHAYDLILDKLQKRKTTKSSPMNFIVKLVATLIIAFVLIGGLFFYISGKNVEDIKNTLASDSNLPIVLIKPFKNMQLVEDSNISISDAVTQALSSSLQQYENITLLSTSTGEYVVESGMSDEEIANQYQVNFLVNGSVQQAGSQIRITSEIVDLMNGRVLWGEKFDFSNTELFKMQDTLSLKILDAMQINATVGQQGSGYEAKFKNFDDYLMMINIIRFLRQSNPDSWNKANLIYKKFMGSDAPEVRKMEISGYHRLVKILVGLSENKKEDIKKLVEFSDQALKLERNAGTHTLRAIIEANVLKNCDKAISHADKISELNAGAISLQISGVSYIGCGAFEKGIVNLKRALKIVPNDTDFNITKNLLTALIMNENFTEAILLSQPTLVKNVPITYILSAYALAKDGKERAAKKLITTQNEFENYLNATRLRSQFASVRDKNFVSKVIQELINLGLEDA